MEIEPRPEQPPAPIAQSDREAVVEALQRAAGDGRLSLQEFSERVGMALTAETRDEVEAATAGLEAAPPVGSTRTVSSVSTLFGNRRQVGRWRLPGALRPRALFGDIYLDLRDVIVSDDVVDISATTLFGNLCVDVPEDQREDIDNGNIWVEGMHQTLERLDQLCTNQPGVATQG